MNDEAYLRLETIVRARALELGAVGLGDRSVRMDELYDDGTRPLRKPRDRLIARLDALERYILLLHRGIHDGAMTTINSLLRERGSELARDHEGKALAGLRAVAELPASGAAGIIEFDLGELPDLNQPLEQLRRLRNIIKEDTDAGFE